ncbi:PepSY domain-containing protein [Pseudoxanthomonas suwonensis]|uniref:PepSY domain-containing protein n=1 Tax=Pseudoxanthomonas suwonensis TaxID=314722 RepID=UPI000466DE0F|nr:PepSY domain-containing protein [Pseudoxanthomonas suwonensis]
MNTTTPSRRHLPFLVLAAALALLPAHHALAGKDDHIEARELLQRGEIVPLARILAVVQQRVPGDVIEVELEREDGRWEYKVKVLTPTGQVRKLYLDARNGAVRKIKDD